MSVKELIGCAMALQAVLFMVIICAISECTMKLDDIANNSIWARHEIESLNDLNWRRAQVKR